MRSIIRTVVLLLLASAVACGRPSAPGVAPSPSAARTGGERFAVLPASAGARTPGSCSAAPEGSRDWHSAGFWVPDAALVREVEVRLPAMLDSVLPVMLRPYRLSMEPRGEQYHRQYLGITRRGERLVFIHGVHEVLVRDDDDLVAWRTGVVNVCDAGPALFGVVYDPRTRTFGPLAFSDAFYPATPP